MDTRVINVSIFKFEVNLNHFHCPCWPKYIGPFPSCWRIKPWTIYQELRVLMNVWTPVKSSLKFHSFSGIETDEAVRTLLHLRWTQGLRGLGVQSSCGVWRQQQGQAMQCICSSLQDSQTSLAWRCENEDEALHERTRARVSVNELTFVWYFMNKMETHLIDLWQQCSKVIISKLLSLCLLAFWCCLAWVWKK